MKLFNNFEKLIAIISSKTDIKNLLLKKIFMFLSY